MENRSDDKLEAGEIRVQSKFLSFLDNFWYHYKWQTIFALIAIVTLTVLCVQCATRKKYDLYFLYAGPETVDGARAEQIGNALAAYAAEEGFSAVLTAYYTMTREQLDRYVEENEVVGMNVAYLSNLVSENRTAFRDHGISGDAHIFFMDPAVYAEEVGRDEGYLPVRSCIPNVPVTALHDETALRLSETKLYPYLKELLPEDTLIVIHLPNVFRRDSEEYQRACEFFASLIDSEGVE